MTDIGDRIRFIGVDEPPVLGRAFRCAMLAEIRVLAVQANDG